MPRPPRGERRILPVVFPPIVNVLFSVVWIALGAPARVKSPENDAVPVVVKFVKLPVDGVVAPIAVPFIPVEVTLNAPEVMSKLFIPVEMVELLRPVKLIAPEVPVMVTPPPRTVNPFSAVKSPEEIISPSYVLITHIANTHPLSQLFSPTHTKKF